MLSSKHSFDDCNVKVKTGGRMQSIVKYSHNGILNTRGSIYPKEYLAVIPGVFYTIVGTT